MMQLLHSHRDIHPGAVLKEEMLREGGISGYELAHSIGVPETRVYDILNGKRAISAETALLLGAFFETGPMYWMNLQAFYDIGQARKCLGEKLERVRRIRK
jgi:addiction module HigA family antidote